MTTLDTGKYMITGTSWASHGTAIILHRYKLLFDCGTIPENMINKILGCRVVCITHGHGDHIGRLHSIPMLRKRKLLEPAQILLPGVCVDGWKRAYSELAALNGGAPRLPTGTRVVDVTKNPIVQIGKDLYLHALPTIHRVESVGYVLTEIRRRLKDEYKGISGKELGDLRKNGVEICTAVELPLFAYTGDTTIEGVLQHDMFRRAEIVVMECTYIDDEVDEKMSKSRGHIHLNEIHNNQNMFEGQIILCHFSPRFSPAEIRRAVESLSWEKPPLLLL